MARPKKIGLDYFPMDTVFTDEKIDLLEAEFGLVGFAILIKLWQKIYNEGGYYISWNDDSLLLFSRKINTEITVVSSVINGCFRRNLLDKNIFEKYAVLTSKGIQKVYFTACKSSKRENVVVVKQYKLVNSEFDDVFTEETQVNSEETGINSEEMPQRKEKESKEKKRESKEDIYTPESGPVSESSNDKIPYEDIVAYLNAKTGSAYKHTSKATQTLIRARWNEKATLQEFYRCIDNMTAKWLNDSKMRAYLRPETLFGTKFESYVNVRVDIADRYESNGNKAIAEFLAEHGKGEIIR